MSHTPGPWKVGGEGNTRVYGPDGSGDDSGLIANVFKGRRNTNLIAAAPELLAALKAASDELILHAGSPLRLQIDAAIAKAEAHADPR